MQRNGNELETRTYILVGGEAVLEIDPVSGEASLDLGLSRARRLKAVVGTKKLYPARSVMVSSDRPVLVEFEQIDNGVWLGDDLSLPGRVRKAAAAVFTAQGYPVISRRPYGDSFRRLD